MCAFREKGDLPSRAQFRNRSGQIRNASLWVVAQAVSAIRPEGDKEKQRMQGLLHQREQIEDEAGQGTLLERVNNLMNWQDRILVDPAILVGKPVIKGTRLAVEFLIELLAEGWTHEQILRNYPQLSEEDIQAALHYAAEALKLEKVYKLAV